MKKYIVLIIYDISDNKRRLKLSKLLEGYGERVQKSAYEARLNKKLFDQMVFDISKLIIEEDNVRIYRLDNYEEVMVFGNKDYGVNSDDDVIII